MKHCHADVLLSALMYLKSQTQVTKHKKALSKLKVSVTVKSLVSPYNYCSFVNNQNLFFICVVN